MLQLIMKMFYLVDQLKKLKVIIEFNNDNIRYLYRYIHTHITIIDKTNEVIDKTQDVMNEAVNVTTEQATELKADVASAADNVQEKAQETATNVQGKILFIVTSCFF